MPTLSMSPSKHTSTSMSVSENMEEHFSIKRRGEKSCVYEFLFFNPSKPELILKKMAARVMVMFFCEFLMTVTKTMMKIKISFSFKIVPRKGNTVV